MKNRMRYGRMRGTMKTVLVAINAKYIHSNLAVHNLKHYCMDNHPEVSVLEYTINHNVDRILEGIYATKPDIIAFSCYIWNINQVTILARELKKLLPKALIWLGGPEVSYDPEKLLQENEFYDLVMVGEGEETFCELLDYYAAKKGTLSQIRGIVYRKDSGEINSTGIREVMSLDQVPFIYQDMKAFEHKIIYYESSRGCPYSCSYCLSSLDKKVRFRDINLVKKELQMFLDAKVGQVKFVDRTFNAKLSHAMEIWRYLKEHDNGVTNFHFEISADIIKDEEIELLQTLRPGQVQFEIGVQSTNPKTLEAIRRKMDFGTLSEISKKIAKHHNIHQHLDLIVGLPYEDYTSFEQSFADVYRLKPNQLQMGFLKVLKGSYMEECAKEYGILYRDYAPYEVLQTNFISFDEVAKLKGVEEMVEIYYNSGQFAASINYLEHFYASPMKLYEGLSDYYNVSSGAEQMAHSRMKRYEILLGFFGTVLEKQSLQEMQKQNQLDLYKDLLIYDLYLRENIKSRPSYAKSEEHLKSVFRDFYYDTKYNRSMTHIEECKFNLEKSIERGEPVMEKGYYLFDYENRDCLDYSAHVVHFSVLQKGEGLWQSESQNN